MIEQEIALRSAKDSRTSEADLDYLAKYSNAEIRREVARHPNASLHSLFLLVEEHPNEVIQNLTRRAPTLSVLMNGEGRVRLREYAKGINYLIDSPLVSTALRASIFSFIEEHNALDLKPEMMATPAGRDRLKAAGFRENIELQAKIIKHPEYPTEKLEAFLLGEVPKFRWAASQHPSLHKSTLMKTLLDMGSTWDLEKYDPSKAKWIDPQEIAKLFYRGYWSQLISSQHPNTPAEALTIMARSPYPDVRIFVAQHENTPSESLTELVQSNDAWALEGVAANPNTPPEVLLKLAERPTLLNVVAANSSAPAALLVKMSGYSEMTQAEVGANPSAPEEALLNIVQAKRVHRTTKQIVAENSAITEKVALALQKDKEVKVRVALAANEKTPPKVLSLLAKDPEVRVRRIVVRHLNTPPKALGILATEKLKEIRERALDHPNNRSFAKLTGQLLSMAKSLYADAQEKRMLVDPLIQRTLMTFDAIAPQGFTPKNTGPVLLPLSEELLQKKEDPLYEYLGTLALDFTKDPKGEDGIALAVLRSLAIDTLRKTGSSSVEAANKIDEMLELPAQE